MNQRHSAPLRHGACMGRPEENTADPEAQIGTEPEGAIPGIRRCWLTRNARPIGRGYHGGGSGRGKRSDEQPEVPLPSFMGVGGLSLPGA